MQRSTNSRCTSVNAQQSTMPRSADFVEQLQKLEFGNGVRRYQPAGRARTGVAGNAGA